MIYSEDLALNNLQRLIGHKTQPTKIFHFTHFSILTLLIEFIPT